MKLSEAQKRVLKAVANFGYFQAGRSEMAKLALARKGLIARDENDYYRWLITDAGRAALAAEGGET